MEIFNKSNELIMRYKEDIFYSTSLLSKFNENDVKLVLITRDCIEKAEIVNLFSRWRKENEFWFQATFPVTNAGTKVWLKNKLIEETNRLLFLIEINNEYIGHVGLWKFDFGKKACEIDNIVRGENKYPGIMYFAIDLLQTWARSTLNIRDFYLQTYLENIKAINLYKKLGYEIVKSEPVINVNEGLRAEWVLAPDNYSGKIERHQIQMALLKK